MGPGLELRRAEAWLISLVAVHSYVVGFLLLFLTRWGVVLGGWTEVSTPFFPRQAGIFHVVVATGYLIEYFRYRGVTFLVTAKCFAVVFLGVTAAVEPVPWAVALSAVGDGLMAVAVLAVRLGVRRQDRRR